MALDTIKNEEIFIDGIEGYGFYRVHNMSKAILVNMLRRFFSKKSPSYKLALTGISEYQNIEDPTKPEKRNLYIEQEFPYFQRRIPGVIVSLDNVDELKLYNGTDSYIGRNYTNGTSAAMYVGAANLPFTITILGESPDMRMDLANLINMCFTHYHRWQYIFVGDDDSSFSIIPAQSRVSFGSNFEVKEGDQKFIYGTTVSFTGYCDYLFSDNLTTSTKYYLINSFEINPLSGPQP